MMCLSTSSKGMHFQLVSWYWEMVQLTLDKREALYAGMFLKAGRS